MEQKNRGLIIPEIITEGDKAHYVLGGYSKIKGAIINPSGDWASYLPTGELQNKGYFEPNACVSFGTNSAVETLFNFFKKIVPNYSDRALAIASNTQPNKGNDPHTVAETARKKLGFVPEEILTFDDSIKTLEQFYSPNPLPDSIIEEGNKFFDIFDFSHEWAFNGGKANEKKLQLEQSLQCGAVCVSVSAWFKNEKGLYYKLQGAIDNHWVQLVSSSPDKYVIFDSYAEADNTPYLKDLDPLYDFSLSKVYYLIPSQPKLSLIEQILNKIAELIPILSFLVKKQVKTPITTPNTENDPKPILDPPVPQEIDSTNLLVKFCQAIQEFEGYYPGSRSFRNCNPGNIKMSSYTKELGAIGADKDNFAIFKIYEDGFNALKQFVKDAGSDKLKLYHDCTIKSFFEVYSDNSLAYANFVAKKLNVNINEKVGSLI